MTVDITEVENRARDAMKAHARGAVAGLDVAKVWEEAARALAAERDQFRDTALMYAADFGALSAGVAKLASGMEREAATARRIAEAPHEPILMEDYASVQELDASRLRALLAGEGAR